MVKTKVACPFCKHTYNSIKGDGCCNCDHTGFVLVGENLDFKNIYEAVNHDPGVSLYDLRYNRENGLPLNYQPF